MTKQKVVEVVSNKLAYRRVRKAELRLECGHVQKIETYPSMDLPKRQRCLHCERGY